MSKKHKTSWPEFQHAELPPMTMTDKQLQPLTHGNVLLVGVKASNFDDDIRNNPRVIMWDSQDEKWQGKAIPINTQAVFMTRWIGHAAFAEIVKEARNKRITIFNPQGTGIIARQVRELLSLNRQTEVTIVEPPVTETKQKETKVPEPTEHHPTSKLHALKPFLDFEKTHSQNAKILFVKAKELGIQTSEQSLAQWSYQERKRAGLPPFRKNAGYDGRSKIVKKPLHDDVTVQMFDAVIKEMQDMRELYVKTMEENVKLRAKVDKFRKFFED